MDRRNVLKILGGSAVIVAAGAGGFVATRTPSQAVSPWAAAGGADYTDPRVRALSWAILAPNPHNRQPWVVDLSVPNEATLYCDLDRTLPETDPYNRQIVIGLGCFLELLRMAAARDGYRAMSVPFPDGADQDALDGRPIARIRFAPDEAVEPDPLFVFASQRRSNKEPYDTSRPVPSDGLDRIARASVIAARAGFTNDMARVERIRALTWAAHQIEVMTPRTLMESIELMRIGKAEINANPDGIDIGGALPDALRMAGVLTRETLADPESEAFRQGLAMYDGLLNSAMGHVWLVTRGNTRIDQLFAGQAWLRMNLAATREGIAIHPLSQSLQEFPEMAELYAAINAELEVEAPARLQMLARVGYGPQVSPSPRWGVEAKIAEEAA